VVVPYSREEAMKGFSRIVVAAVAILAAAGAPTALGAQEQATVTGCLSQGSQGTFSITGEDGAAYELTATTVELAGHVGHRVRITGTPAPVETGAVEQPGMARDDTVGDTGTAHDSAMAHEGHDAAAPAGGGQLEVTGLEMVGTDCE
jgi:hypothetical protein